MGHATLKDKKMSGIRYKVKPNGLIDFEKVRRELITDEQDIVIVVQEKKEKEEKQEKVGN